jgi:hypothetical protein
MSKYEADVQFPAVAGVQKPGADRYAVPQKVADGLMDKLADGSAVEADWDDGCKLSVTVEPKDVDSAHTMEAAQAALQEEVGPDAKVSPFHPSAEGS